MKFEWDEEKNQKNIKKHNISFEEAKTVFYDKKALFDFDKNHSDDEDRFIIIGESNLQRTLIVCHCIRYNDIIRIISARQISEKEYLYYKEKLGGKL